MKARNRAAETALYERASRGPKPQQFNGLGLARSCWRSQGRAWFALTLLRDPTQPPMATKRIRHSRVQHRGRICPAAGRAKHGQV